MSAAPDLMEVAGVLDEAAEAADRQNHYVARELVASALPTLHVQSMDFAVFRDGTVHLFLDGVPYILSDFQRAALSRGINRGEAPE